MPNNVKGSKAVGGKSKKWTVSGKLQSLASPKSVVSGIEAPPEGEPDRDRPIQRRCLVLSDKRALVREGKGGGGGGACTNTLSNSGHSVTLCAPLESKNSSIGLLLHFGDGKKANLYSFSSVWERFVCLECVLRCFLICLSYEIGL